MDLPSSWPTICSIIFLLHEIIFQTKKRITKRFVSARTINRRRENVAFVAYILPVEMIIRSALITDNDSGLNSSRAARIYGFGEKLSRGKCAIDAKGKMNHRVGGLVPREAQDWSHSRLAVRTHIRAQSPNDTRQVSRVYYRRNWLKRSRSESLLAPPRNKVSHRLRTMQQLFA